MLTIIETQQESIAACEAYDANVDHLGLKLYLKPWQRVGHEKLCRLAATPFKG